MIRWLIVVFLVLLVINSVSPWLRKLGVGRLPGDLRFRFLGRDWFLPFTSTVLLSLVAALIAKFI
ncbi:MAG: hypothetical protein RLZZ591_1213 [Pseudomonadota bacterium]|jgi:hypothetical protein